MVTTNGTIRIVFKLTFIKVFYMSYTISYADYRSQECGAVIRKSIVKFADVIIINLSNHVIFTGFFQAVNWDIKESYMKNIL